MLFLYRRRMNFWPPSVFCNFSATKILFQKYSAVLHLMKIFHYKKEKLAYTYICIPTRIMHKTDRKIHDYLGGRWGEWVGRLDFPHLLLVGLCLKTGHPPYLLGYLFQVYLLGAIPVLYPQLA